jgi:uncharacterized protein
MSTTERGIRLRIYVGEDDHWHDRSLSDAIVHEARRCGLAGATVARGVMGFGAHNVVHEAHLFSKTHERPVVIEIVDTQEKIDAFLPVLDTMLDEGLVTTSEVEIVRFSAEA